MLDPSGFELPAIPSKRYFTIGEVSNLCDTKQHVLRYWEGEFPQLKPVRRGSRRCYQIHDIKLIRHIRILLHVKGFTISGAKSCLQQSASENDTTANVSEQDTRKIIALLITELVEVQEILN